MPSARNRDGNNDDDEIDINDIGTSLHSIVDERVKEIYDKKYEIIVNKKKKKNDDVDDDDDDDDIGKGELWLVKLPPGSLIEDFHEITVKFNSANNNKNKKRKINEGEGVGDEEENKKLATITTTSNTTGQGEFPIGPNEIGRIETKKGIQSNEDDDDDQDRRFRIIGSETDQIKNLRVGFDDGDDDMDKALKNTEKITKRIHILHAAGFKKKKEDILKEGKDEVKEEKEKKKNKSESKLKQPSSASKKKTNSKVPSSSAAKKKSKKK